MRFRPSSKVEPRDYWRDQGWSVPKYFSDEQLSILEQNPEYRAMATPCIICDGTGSYRFRGKQHQCPDDTYGHVVMRLAKLYWLSNIPLQYQQLSWHDWPKSSTYSKAKKTIDDYLKNFSQYKMSGIGLTIYSDGLGTGKTWAATHVLKHLVKQGYDGWFVPFYEVKGYHDIEDYERREFLVKRIKESLVLVLDEVQRPISEPSKRFYADRLEELIRPRTNSNLPTIITTNLTLEEMEDTYPRVFSLLALKNILIELSGPDARYSNEIWQNQLDMSKKGERRPIE